MSEVIEKDTAATVSSPSKKHILPKKLVSPKIIIPHPDLIIDGNYLYKAKRDKDKKILRDKNGEIEKEKIGRKILIDKVNKSLETGKIDYDLEIYTTDGNIAKLENLDRSLLVEKDVLLETVSYGSDVKLYNVWNYINSIENQELMKEKEYYHKQIGWHKFQGEKIYKHQNVISKNKSLKSTYKGEKTIETKGTLENWCEFIKEEVIGHTPLEAAIAMGLSAVVVGYLDNKNTNIFHIYGDSTTGKTTAGELIVGLGTKPTMQEDGLMYSWNATINALIGRLRDNNGLPVLIDDCSVSRIKDFSTLIYQMEMGKDKDRMNKEGEMKETQTWNTTIISTGEKSLIDNSNQNDGIRVRLIEIGDVKWTKSAEHSDKIKQGARENYGHGTLVVAEELLKIGDEILKEELLKYKEKAKDKLEKDNKCNNFTDRILDTYSTVMVGISILENNLKLGFHIDEISKFLLKHLVKDNRTLADRAYDYILEYVEGNNTKFNRKVYLESFRTHTFIEAKNNYKTLGIIEDIDVVNKKDKETGKKEKIVEKEIVILENEFSKILKEGGFNNPKGILKEFKEKGLLNCESDRYTRKRKITEGGNVVRVIVIKVKTPYVENEEIKNEYYKRERERKKAKANKETKKIDPEKIEEIINSNL